MGNNPEALCGEAPKGQPMSRRENLEAVCVEARKVSQGTTDTIQESNAAEYQGESWRSEGKDETHHRHGGRMLGE